MSEQLGFVNVVFSAYTYAQRWQVVCI